MVPRLNLVVGVVATAILSATSLSAQRATEANDAQLRAHCRLAAQVLETGHPSTHYGWAISQIRRCE